MRVCIRMLHPGLWVRSYAVFTCADGWFRLKSGHRPVDAISRTGEGWEPVRDVPSV